MNQSMLINKLPVKEKIMSLTFDDYVTATNASDVLNILKQYNVKSTFFLIGEAVDRNPQLTNVIIQQGHEISNHSYTHPFFTRLNEAEIKLELEKTEEAVARATNNITIKPFFRPPYDDYESIVLDYIGSMGYPWTILFTIDTYDYNNTPADIMAQSVLDNAEPGAIVMMHLHNESNTAEALPMIIKGLKAMGYKLVKVSEMLPKVYRSPLSIPYVVRPEDTLTEISRRFKVSVGNIIKANNISDPINIYVNQVLTIPLNDLKLIHYIIQPDDTLQSISERFGVTVDDLISLNNISNPDNIYFNQILAIPAI